MDRVKIQEIAVEAGASNAVLIEKAKELGYDVKVANSTVTVEQAGILVDYMINGVKPKVAKPKPKVVKKVDIVKEVKVEENIKEVTIVESEAVEVKAEEKVETPVAKKATPSKRKSRIGSITATPKKKKVEVVKVEETVTTEEKVAVIEETETTESKVEEAKTETPSTEEVVKDDATTKETESTEEAVKEEEPVVEKSKARRKRIGITVVKKADRDKPRIRIVDERLPV
ncbi:MAG TPA: hypothetical protein EYG94_02635, partial [Campylobacterales bacterium]|nr:hypothetical protein [Campylobacterales bacterium]